MDTFIKAEIITSGSEIMRGQLVDSNTAWLSAFLAARGVPVVRHTSVGDDRPGLIRAFRRAWEDHDLILVTGGLGPTEDDLARPAAAEAFGRALAFREDLAQQLRRHFQRRGVQPTDNNYRQAYLPEGFLSIENHHGSAPGFYLEEGPKLMAFMPGVPSEMRRMTQSWLEPMLNEKYRAAGRVIQTEILKVAGLGESVVDSRVGDLMTSGENPEVGLLAAPDLVRVLVTARAGSREQALELMAPVLAELEKRLEGHIFGRGEETLPQAIDGLLARRGLKLLVLDAVTGGRLIGALAPDLAPERFAGAVELNWRPGPEEALNILAAHFAEPAGPAGLEGAVRLALTAEPDPDGPLTDGDMRLIVHTQVRTGPGRPAVFQDRVGGTPEWALTRASALSLFRLWKALNN